MLIVVFAAFLRIRQFQSRSRASDVIAVMRGVKAGGNACQEVSKLTSRWPKYATVHGNCDRGDLFAEVTFQTPRLPAGAYETYNRALRVLVGAYQLVAGRFVQFSAEVIAKDGVVRQTTTSFIEVVPNRDPTQFVQTLQQAVVIVRRIDDILPSREPVEMYQQRVHPTLRVFRDSGTTNLDTGGPLYDFMHLGVEIRSNASHEDINRFFAFNLSCYTRLKSCSEREFMPAAYDQFEADSRAQRNLGH